MAATEETEKIDIDKLKERINKGIPYFLGIKPSRFGKTETKHFFTFLGLVEKYMVGKSSIRINKAISFFRKIDPGKFNVATWFYVLHFVLLFKKYINGEDINKEDVISSSPVQLDTFETAKEIFSS